MSLSDNQPDVTIDNGFRSCLDYVFIGKNLYNPFSNDIRTDTNVELNSVTTKHAMIIVPFLLEKTANKHSIKEMNKENKHLFDFSSKGFLEPPESCLSS